jgi:tRNA-(ms[2]io[6]A)-hydroxylase
MLHLASTTDPGWLGRALSDLDELLLDHAHCEQKAAGNAISLLFRYPQHAFLMAPLAALAREELAHFQQVLERLAERGARFRPQRASPYAGRLRSVVRGPEPGRLVDTLLCSAVIEARSCERFQLLAEGVPDVVLAAFYRGLLASEARHHQVFLELAEELAPRDEVLGRLDAIARHEADVLAGSPALARLHA